jgi:alpha-amylase/alpha-mannosidase (GH57 family)
MVLYPSNRIAEPVEQITVLLNENKVSRGLFIMENVQEAIDTIMKPEFNLINFFTDFEIYGEHNKDREHGLLQVMEDIIQRCIDNGIVFNTVTEAGKTFIDEEYSSEEYTTWANTFADLRTWVGEGNQNRAHRKMTVLLTLIKNLEPRWTEEYDEILEMWRKLSTSDQFYYMPIYPEGSRENMSLELFSPYDSAQEAYDLFVKACDFLTRKIIQANVYASKSTLPIAHKSHGIYN